MRYWTWLVTMSVLLSVMIATFLGDGLADWERQPADLPAGLIAIAVLLVAFGVRTLFHYHQEAAAIEAKRRLKNTLGFQFIALVTAPAHTLAMLLPGGENSSAMRVALFARDGRLEGWRGSGASPAFSIPLTEISLVEPRIRSYRDWYGEFIVVLESGLVLDLAVMSALFGGRLTPPHRMAAIVEAIEGQAPLAAGAKEPFAHPWG